MVDVLVKFVGGGFGFGSQLGEDVLLQDEGVLDVATDLLIDVRVRVHSLVRTLNLKYNGRIINPPSIL